MQIHTLVSKRDTVQIGDLKLFLRELKVREKYQYVTGLLIIITPSRILKWKNVKNSFIFKVTLSI